MNDDHAYAGLGACEDREFELVELVDGALTPERAAATRQHLAACPRCRAFVQELQAVDAALAAALPLPRLSAGFDARLHERLEALRVNPARQVALAAAEDEYRRLLGALRRGLTWRTGFNAVAAASACGGLAVALTTAGPTLLRSLGIQGGASFASAGMGLEIGIAAVACLCGLAAARLLGRRPLATAFG